MCSLEGEGVLGALPRRSQLFGGGGQRLVFFFIVTVDCPRVRIDCKFIRPWWEEREIAETVVWVVGCRYYYYCSIAFFFFVVLACRHHMYREGYFLATTAAVIFLSINGRVRARPYE